MQEGGCDTLASNICEKILADVELVEGLYIFGDFSQYDYGTISWTVQNHATLFCGRIDQWKYEFVLESAVTNYQKACPLAQSLDSSCWQMRSRFFDSYLGKSI